MSVLAAPPPRPTRPNQFRPRPSPTFRLAPAMELPVVSFFGRTLAEYTRFLGLDIDSLRGRDVLDVAAGPSSFVAEACVRRINAVAVDPFYSAPAEDLAARVDSDYSRMFAQIRAKPQLFKVGTVDPTVDASDEAAPYFASIDDAEADRRLAAQRFLADYEAHFSHGRYVGAALPRLPFFDRTFDLGICAHLLFIYAARFDHDWHLAACRELVRVSAGEVRIHPVCGPDGRPYPKLPALRRELRSEGIESQVVNVPYEFFVGSTSTLVLRRASS